MIFAGESTDFQKKIKQFVQDDQKTFAGKFEDVFKKT